MKRAGAFVLLALLAACGPIDSSSELFVDSEADCHGRGGEWRCPEPRGKERTSESGCACQEFR